MSESRHHYDHGMVWVPVADFAREYHKSRTAIKNWIADGFIFTLGFRVKKDVKGNVYIGKPQSESTVTSATPAILNTSSLRVQ